MTPARLCLFDVDATLVLTGGAGRRALDGACLEVLGIPEACAAVRMDGMTDPLIIDAVYQQHRGRDATPIEREEILARYLRLLEDEVAGTTGYRVLPGVVQLLDALALDGAVVGLATGNVEPGARIKLARGGLWERFPFGGFGSDHADRAAVVACAIERGELRASRRFAPDEVLVIGDTPRDIAAARACGVRAVAVATGSHSLAELRACAPDLAIETLEELEATLRGLP